MLIPQTREQHRIRFRKALADGTIETLQTEIETKYGLLPGSVKIVMPSGRKQQRDTTVRRLKENWERLTSSGSIPRGVLPRNRSVSSRNPILGRSGIGGFWFRKVENVIFQ